MREIKFKILDKSSQEFYSDEGLELWQIKKINSLDDWEFLQYTGLKDKNGIEIYEGDIMGLDANSFPTFQVKYVGNRFILSSSVVYFDVPAYFNERVVIGNIYENSDLLDK